MSESLSELIAKHVMGWGTFISRGTTESWAVLGEDGLWHGTPFRDKANWQPETIAHHTFEALEHFCRESDRWYSIHFGPEENFGDPTYWVEISDPCVEASAQTLGEAACLALLAAVGVEVPDA